MKEKLKNFGQRHFGPAVPVKSRLFYSLSLCGSALAALSAAAAALLRFPPLSVAVCTLCALIVLGVTAYGYASGRTTAAAVLLLLLTNCVLLPAAYFTTGALRGQTLLFCLPALYACVPLLTGRLRARAFGLSLLAHMLMIALGQWLPAWIAPLPAQPRAQDAATALLMAGTGLFVIAMRVDAERAKEQHKVNRLNAGLREMAVGFRYMATQDALTGLYNKAAIEQMCGSYLQMREAGEPCALIVLDMNDFKSVNDTLGHQAGDMALQTMGRCLRYVFRAEDLKGRIGGDEFLLMLKCFDNEAMLRHRVTALRAKLGKETSAALGRSLNCSVGAVLSPNATADYETLFAAADAALYEAKRAEDCFVVREL